MGVSLELTATHLIIDLIATHGAMLPTAAQINPVRTDFPPSEIHVKEMAPNAASAIPNSARALRNAAATPKTTTPATIHPRHETLTGIELVMVGSASSHRVLESTLRKHDLH